MRRLRPAVRKNPFRKFIFVIILLALLFIVYIFIRSNFFKIHSFNLNLFGLNCADEKNIREKSNILNRSIFFINEKYITSDLKNKFICIKNVQFTKRLPDKILVDIKGRIPFAEIIPVRDFEASISALIDNVSTPSGILNESYLVDDEGVVFAKGFADVPKIYFLRKEVSVGEKFEDEYLNKTLFILKLFKELGMNNSEGYIIDNFLITNSYPKVVFHLDGEINGQIASLQLILQKAKIDNKELEFVDLRFDKPIIKYAPKR